MLLSKAKHSTHPCRPCTHSTHSPSQQSSAEKCPPWQSPLPHPPFFLNLTPPCLPFHFTTEAALPEAPQSLHLARLAGASQISSSTSAAFTTVLLRTLPLSASSDLLGPFLCSSFTSWTLGPQEGNPSRDRSQSKQGPEGHVQNLLQLHLNDCLLPTALSSNLYHLYFILTCS